jgi:hypothetical protein
MSSTSVPENPMTPNGHTLLSEGEFLTTANGRARTRLFTATDYVRFATACADAIVCAHARLPFYRADDAGGMANKYAWWTTTARWAVWTTNAGEVVTEVGRVEIHGQHVPCAYFGGERQYRCDFRHGVVAFPRPASVPRRWPTVSPIDDAPTQCSECQEPLCGVWYDGQWWGETLCEDCYDARVAAGLAKPALEPA